MMSYADAILPEFDQEMASTRKVLERVPEDKWDWKAHPKSNTIGWNANHLAEIPGWVAGTFTGTEWDFAPPDGPRYESPSFKKREEVLKLFDDNVASARNATLSNQHQLVARRARRARYQANLTGERWRQAIDEHDRIIDALEARDAPRLGTLMKEHMEHKLQSLKPAIED